jgi:hypothetical protein
MRVCPGPIPPVPDRLAPDRLFPVVLDCLALDGLFPVVPGCLATGRRFPSRPPLSSQWLGHLPPHRRPDCASGTTTIGCFGGVRHLIGGLSMIHRRAGAPGGIRATRPLMSTARRRVRPRRLVVRPARHHADVRPVVTRSMVTLPMVPGPGASPPTKLAAAARPVAARTMAARTMPGRPAADLAVGRAIAGRAVAGRAVSGLPGRVVRLRAGVKQAVAGPTLLKRDGSSRQRVGRRVMADRVPGGPAVRGRASRKGSLRAQALSRPAQRMRVHDEARGSRVVRSRGGPYLAVRPPRTGRKRAARQRPATAHMSVWSPVRFGSPLRPFPAIPFLALSRSRSLL